MFIEVSQLAQGSDSITTSIGACCGYSWPISLTIRSISLCGLGNVLIVSRTSSRRVNSLQNARTSTSGALRGKHDETCRKSNVPGRTRLTGLASTPRIWSPPLPTTSIGTLTPFCRSTSRTKPDTVVTRSSPSLKYRTYSLGNPDSSQP